MGNICIDYACAGCGDFYDAYTCDTEEKLRKFEDKHKGEVHYCDNCETFTEFGTSEEVKVVFTLYGKEIGMQNLMTSLRKYMNTKNGERIIKSWKDSSKYNPCMKIIKNLLENLIED